VPEHRDLKLTQGRGALSCQSLKLAHVESPHPRCDVA